MKQLDIFEHQPSKDALSQNPEVTKLETTLKKIEDVYSEIIKAFNTVQYDEGSVQREVIEINKLYGKDFATYTKVPRQDGQGGYRYIITTLDERALRNHIAQIKAETNVAA